MISGKFRSLRDPRQKKTTDHTVHDALMSGLTCLYFQEPSLLQFQTEMEKAYHKNNMTTLFEVKKIPSSNTIKDILDNQDSELFQPIHKNVVQQLQRGKQLKKFDLFSGYKICSIDATQYHTSHSIHCSYCLTANKDNPDKPTRYYHTALQAAIMHPDVKQVIPLGAEPIKKSDRQKKQDCEINAAKRFIPKLRQQFPKMNLIITGDDLNSRQPMIAMVLENHYNYFFVAKASSHTFMTEWLQEKEPLNEIQHRFSQTL